MAQKIHPLNYRSLHNYENLDWLQQPYGFFYSSYILYEQLTLIKYLKNIFDPFRFSLHSLKYAKASNGTVFLGIKYVSCFFYRKKERLKKKNFFLSSWGVQKKEGSEKNRMRFPNLERSFFYGLSYCLPAAVLCVFFYNLVKIKVPFPEGLKNYFFNHYELSAYLKILLFTKGGAFFLANILSTKMHLMRSRLDRKKQTQFLFFVKVLLSFLLAHNRVNLSGLKVCLKGRIRGVPRTKSWVFSIGKMAFQQISATVDYSFLPAQTVYGTFGIKVWIHYKKNLFHAAHPKN